MSWKIIFYETVSHKLPVAEFIYSLEKATQAKVIRNIDLLKEFGNGLGIPYSKKIDSRLYELRVRGREEVRIFYTFGQSRTVYLLHGFKKKSQKTPEREIETALKRIDLIYHI